MQLEQLRALLQDKKMVTEEIPFGPEVLVYKVVGKVFAILAWQEEPLKISLKCDPERALVLRSVYDAIQAGYHLNKKHWNTITLDNSVPEQELSTMIEDSYWLVVKGLKKADREKVTGRGGCPKSL